MPLHFSLLCEVCTWHTITQYVIDVDCLGVSVRIHKNIEAQHSDDILRIMSVRIFRLVTKICVKNILRIFQAHFRENVKNTEPGRKFHHSYKKKRVFKVL